MGWGPLLIFAAMVAVDALFVWSCAMIAKTKGYSPWTWGILAFFFFGVFILVVLLLLPTRTSPEDGDPA